jgi:hypothetical protein
MAAMSTRPLLALALALLCRQSEGADAAEQVRALMAVRAQGICLMQDPAYEQSFVGRWFAATPHATSWSDLEKLPIARCLRERQFLSRAFCDDITRIAPYKEGQPSEKIAGFAVVELDAATLASALDRHPEAAAIAEAAAELKDDAISDPKTFSCPARLAPLKPDAP